SWAHIYTNELTTLSDRRLKEDIRPLRDSLNRLLSLKPVSFTFRSKPDSEAELGLIAQETARVIPEAVAGQETGGSLGVRYTSLVPLLVGALKERHVRIGELRGSVDRLETRIKRIKAIASDLGVEVNVPREGIR
ncbi:MAG: tail fiber domain-containing protein, partial [Planctomycetes bacterium]|nr:tail fiber domain-containing protein [Planctomycetota bacterium]